MIVALSKGDVTAARAAYHQMSGQGRSAAMTQYLMYKLALQDNDAELGRYLSSCTVLLQLNTTSHEISRRHLEVIPQGL